LSQTGQIGVRGGYKEASEGREMTTTTEMNVTLKQEGERGYLRKEGCYFDMVFILAVKFCFLYKTAV